MKDILHTLDVGDNDGLDIERIKLSSLYADFDGDGVLCPSQWFSDKSKVEITLKSTRLHVQLFRNSALPLFDAVTECSLDQCQEWIENLQGLL
jgi:hypothetical protein